MAEDSVNPEQPENTSIWADEKTVDTRREICNNCEHYKLNVCMLCGCFLPGKIRLTPSRCPANKW